MSEICFTPILRDGKYGFADADGNLVVPCELDEYIIHEVINEDYYGEEYHEDVAILRKGDTYGILNLYSSQYCPPQWDEIIPIPCSDDEDITYFRYQVRQENRFGLLNWDLAPLAPCQWEGIGAVLPGHVQVRQNGLMGLIRFGGKVVTPCLWEDVMPWGLELVAVQRGGKWGLLNQDNQVVSPCQWDEIAFGILEGASKTARRMITAVCIDGKWGYIRGDGSELSPCLWDYADGFVRHLARVKQDGKWGLLDFTGALVCPCQYDDILIELDDDCCFRYKLCKDGVTELVTPPAQWDASTESIMDETFCVDQGVRIGGKWGFLRATGSWISPCQWEDAQSFNGTLAPVCKDGLWGLMDKDGQLAVPCRFQALRNCSGRFFAAMLDGKWGYLRKDGTELTSCQWEDVRDFDYQFGAVKQDGKWGFVDETGALVLEPQWEDVGTFIFQTCPVMQDGKWGFLHNSGKLLLPCQWDTIQKRGAHQYRMYCAEQEDSLFIRRHHVVCAINGERTVIPSSEC